MDTHNIGGLRRLGGPPWDWDYPHHRRWETADIAILVFIYRGDHLVAKKIGLLQSKRLYPLNNDVEGEDGIGLFYGMNAFLRREDQQAAASLHRKFEFNGGCIYGSIHAGAHQIELIDKLNEEFGKAVYYLLYHPHQLPYSIEYPLRQRIKIVNSDVGCRVIDAGAVHGVLANLIEGGSPSYSMIMDASRDRERPLEVWAADLLLTCKVGEQFDHTRDDRVRYFLERRSGPIGSALAASITLPD